MQAAAAAAVTRSCFISPFMRCTMCSSVRYVYVRMFVGVSLPIGPLLLLHLHHFLTL